MRFIVRSVSNDYWMKFGSMRFDSSWAILAFTNWSLRVDCDALGCKFAAKNRPNWYRAQRYRSKMAHFAAINLSHVCVARM